MIIPREGDLVRLYVQLTDAEVLNPETGRVDKDKMGPEKLMEVAQRTFHPFKIDTKAFDWWTIYISEFPEFMVGSGPDTASCSVSRATRGVQVLGGRACVYRWRCLSYTFAKSR